MSLNQIYTDKQIEVLREVINRDWFMLINSGAKRSGKTVVNNDIFLMELKRVKQLALKDGVKQPMYILAGVSSGTIYKNVLQELYNKYGLDVKFDKYNNFTLFGVKVVLARTGTIQGVGAIRGMTSYGAYINEASLANPQVFQEIVSRCSGTGARIICDTNPDNPEHWLKKNYIDNGDESILNFHFTLEDNTFLSQRYIESIKSVTPSGMFYDRDILGLWVTGEGVVYPDFDRSKHYITIEDLPSITIYYAGVDWGYEHYGSIVVLGEDKNGNTYLVEEIARQYQEIEYWVNRALDIKERYGNIVFYCDSARPEHVARFQREGLRAVNAGKFVISGIEEVSRLMKNDKFYVVESKVNKFKQEIYQYIWDKRSGSPVKQNDDVMDALRYATEGIRIRTFRF